jgi:puromycin-sensitive aminopeptidase
LPSLEAEISFNEKAETVTLEFGEVISAGPARLEIDFTGVLNDKLRGFYRSEYPGPGGESRYLATTQFEATDARRAFPCWDEPAHKATFQVTLVFPSNLSAVSNTQVLVESEAGPGLKSVRFAETPVMSTYLLAFVVGDLVSTESEYSGSGITTRVGVWTTPGNEEKGAFALDTSVKLLKFFNDYFGIPYPLEKLDHIAIPDFAAGAMENWGAITYRETALLVDPDNSSAGTRQRVAEVVAHEMAHMWFGDLVTMEWWDDLWLNESFASWMGTKAVDWLFPDWEMWTQFVNMDTNRALSLDGLKNSHPIEQEVNDPAEVSQLFDAISYSKGASVLRMLEQFLGPEIFRKGLQSYISANQYGNARTEHLWAALEEASQQPVTAIMDSWVKQMGYPVLNVETSTSGGQLDLDLSQERFVYDRLLGGDDEGSQVWRVPVGVSSGGQPSQRLVMEGPNARMQIPALSSDVDWFKVNSDQTGFFRVNYSREDWDRLVPAIRSLALPATDRLGIQNDAYALSRAGILGVTQFLSLAAAYQNETDASVWSDLASNLREIDLLLAAEPYHGRFRAASRDLFAPAAARSGWDARPGEGHLDALLRSTVLSQAGAYQDPETIRQATNKFKQYLEDRSAVPPDLRGVVISLAAQAGDRVTYDQIWDLEKETSLAEEKIRLLLSLARFTQPELLQETLDRALTDDVRSQDTITVVTAVAGNLDGRQLAWDFVKDRWGEFDRRYGGGGFGLMRLVSVCGNFTDQEHLDEVEQFFASHPAPAAERTIRQAKERINLHIAWLGNNRSQLAEWFGG